MRGEEANVPWLLLVVGASIMGALANISIKHGLLQVDALLTTPVSLWQRIPLFASNAFIWLGLAGLGMAFLLWIIALSNLRLGHAYPIYVALEYTLVMLLSWLILGDTFAPAKIAGIAIILVGLVVINF
jgi:multidrug transporter EmrE-like cation transporter